MSSGKIMLENLHIHPMWTGSQFLIKKLPKLNQVQLSEVFVSKANKMYDYLRRNKIAVQKDWIANCTLILSRHTTLISYRPLDK